MILVCRWGCGQVLMKAIASIDSYGSYDLMKAIVSTDLYGPYGFCMSVRLRREKGLKYWFVCPYDFYRSVTLWPYP